MHYDEQRENDITNTVAKKTKLTLPYSSTVNQHINITWHLNEIVKKSCVDLVNKPKENI